MTAARGRLQVNAGTLRVTAQKQHPQAAHSLAQQKHWS